VSVCLSVCLSVFPFFCLSLCFCRSFLWLCLCLCLCLCLSVSLIFFSLSLSLSHCLSLCLSLSLNVFCFNFFLHSPMCFCLSTFVCLLHCLARLVKTSLIDCTLLLKLTNRFGKIIKIKPLNVQNCFNCWIVRIQLLPGSIFVGGGDKSGLKDCQKSLIPCFSYSIMQMQQTNLRIFIFLGELKVKQAVFIVWVRPLLKKVAEKSKCTGKYYLTIKISLTLPLVVQASM
jgi:hypothetical protein